MEFKLWLEDKTRYEIVGWITKQYPNEAMNFLHELEGISQDDQAGDLDTRSVKAVFDDYSQIFGINLRQYSDAYWEWEEALRHFLSQYN